MKYVKLLLFFLGMGALVNAQKVVCNDDCCKKIAVSKRETPLSCKLTTPELRERKATVIASLKKQVMEKKELRNGYAYKFAGSDNTVDEIANFIKTERMCCDFFTFNMSVRGDKSEAWLEITGPKGAKEFITSELDM